MSTPEPLTLWEVFAAEDDTVPSSPLPHVTCPTCAGHGTIVPTLAQSRTGDRDTARAAGDAQDDDVRFAKDSRQAQALRALHARPGTAHEVARRVLGEHAPVARVEGMRRRVSSLAHLALVEDSGDRATNPGSNRPAIVWRITAAGRVALDRLERTGWSV